MDEAKRFWMAAGRGPSNHRHSSQGEAEREAKRLARENPGQWFVVVEAVSAHRKIDVESISLRQSRDDDDMPF